MTRFIFFTKTSNFLFGHKNFFDVSAWSEMLRWELLCVAESSDWYGHGFSCFERNIHVASYERGSCQNFLPVALCVGLLDLLCICYGLPGFRAKALETRSSAFSTLGSPLGSPPSCSQKRTKHAEQRSSRGTRRSKKTKKKSYTTSRKRGSHAKRRTQRRS
jgi:hypothetical protein